jgi:hypothetical protein
MAKITIDQLPDASALTGSENLALTQSGVTKKIDIDTAKAYINDPLVRADYAGSATIVPNGTPAQITNLGTLTEDTNSAASTITTDWKYTIPIAGIYMIEIATSASVASSSNASFSGYININGGGWTKIAFVGMPATIGGCELIGQRSFRFNISDVLRVALSATNNTSGNTTAQRVRITRLGA